MRGLGRCASSSQFSISNRISSKLFLLFGSLCPRQFVGWKILLFLVFFFFFTYSCCAKRFRTRLLNVAVYQIGEVRSSDGRAGRVVSRWRIPLLRRIFLKELEKRKESTNLFIRFFFPFFFFLLLEKIIYPRNTRTLTKTSVVGGKPIDEKTCMVIR